MQALLIKQVDWSRLQHAYGWATDTPEHLKALASDAPETIEAAIDHLWSALIHQGTPWTATAPATKVILAYLNQPNCSLSLETQWHLVRFLLEVAGLAWQTSNYLTDYQTMAAFDLEPFLSGDAEELYDNEEAANAFYAHSLLGCYDLAPEIFNTLWSLLTRSDDYMLRMPAAMGAGFLVKIPSLAEHQTALIQRLQQLLNQNPTPDECCTYLLVLGELQVAHTEYLSAESPIVRLGAALALPLANYPQARAVLIELLEQHLAIMDDGFRDTPPQFYSTLPRFKIIQQLIESEIPFAVFYQAALAVLQVASKYTVDQDWGRLLACAFKDQSGVVRTAEQYAFLKALVDKTEFWDERFGNPSAWFQAAGLTYNRQACQQCLVAFESLN